MAQMKLLFQHSKKLESAKIEIMISKKKLSKMSKVGAYCQSYVESISSKVAASVPSLIA